MTDFIPDGQPFEMPETAADLSYAETPPPFGRAFRAMVTESSGLAYLARAAERGSQAGSSWFDQGLYQGGLAEEAQSPYQPEPVQLDPEQSDVLPAAEINKRYAPEGVSITDKPMPEKLGEIIGRQKAESMRRESVLARSAAVNSWPVNFGAGMAAFMLDPLNAATTLIPGLGEESVTAALGRVGLSGIPQRMGARAIVGAVGGAEAQVPLSALRYGLSGEEASDYTLRDALRDVFYSAAGGAAIHAGVFGTLRELRWPRAAPGRPLGAPEEAAAPEAPAAVPEAPAEAVAPETPEAAPVAPEPSPEPLPPEVHEQAAAATSQPANIHADTMRAAVSEVLDGRPVDVQPVLDATPPRIRTLEEIQQQDGVSARKAQEIQTQELLARGRPISMEEMAARKAGVQQIGPADVAAQQRDLQRDGYATGVPQADLQQATADLYQPKVEEEAPAEQPTAPAQRAAPEATPSKPPATPFEKLPPEPERLASFLRRMGGIRDDGGDIRHTLGGAKYRPGLVNQNGMSLDEAARLAWDHGYLSGAERPEINALLDALSDDLGVTPRYSEHDIDAVRALQEAHRANEEIVRLASDYDIDYAGMNRDQFFDALAERMGQDDLAAEIASQEEAHQAAYEEAERQAKAWVAFHGTPHTFDAEEGAPFGRFKLEKIGTGEGTQAFGHGFYFAEHEGTAAYYRAALSPAIPARRMPEYIAYQERMGELDALHTQMMAETRRTDPNAINPSPQVIAEHQPEWDTKSRAATEAKDAFDKAVASNRPGGNLLAVRINAAPEEMIDLDKPFIDQPQRVQDALRAKIADLQERGEPMMSGYVRDVNRGTLPGSAVYSGLGAGTPESASAAWRRVGIKGVVYLDRQSRDAGEGTRNVVIFDPRDVEITHRNGEPATHAEFNAGDFYGQSQARTLADLEAEYRQEDAAIAAQQRAAGGEQPGPAAGREGAVSGGGEPRGGGAGAAGGAGAPTVQPVARVTDLLGRPVAEPASRRTPEPTIRNDTRQTALPGTEPSARQAQAARDAAGPRSGQLPANEGLFARPETEQASLLDPETTAAMQELAAHEQHLTPEDAAELRAADDAVQTAEYQAAAAEQAAACLKGNA